MGFRNSTVSRPCIVVVEIGLHLMVLWPWPCTHASKCLAQARAGQPGVKVPKMDPSKWKHGLTTGVALWFNFDTRPYTAWCWLVMFSFCSPPVAPIDRARGIPGTAAASNASRRTPSPLIALLSFDVHSQVGRETTNPGFHALVLIDLNPSIVFFWEINP